MKTILLFSLLVCCAGNSFSGYNTSSCNTKQVNNSQSDSGSNGSGPEKGKREDSLLLVTFSSNQQSDNLQITDTVSFTGISRTNSNSEIFIQRKHNRLEALKEVCDFLFGSINTLGGPVEYDALSLQLFFFTR